MSFWSTHSGLVVRNQLENDPEVANIFALSIDGTASGDVSISDRGNWICWFATLTIAELRFPEKS